MKCYICDRQLGPDEIHLNPDHGTFDPCGVCLEIIENVFEPLKEEEIGKLLELFSEWEDFFYEQSESP